jgi:hypothetical protein
MAGAPCCSTQRGRRGEELERCWDLTRAWNWVEVHASSGSERANASSGSERAKGSAVGVGLGYQAHWSACLGQCNFFILALKKTILTRAYSISASWCLTSLVHRRAPAKVASWDVDVVNRPVPWWTLTGTLGSQ